MEKVKEFFKDLWMIVRTGSSFKGDPYGWATSQAGHSAIVGQGMAIVLYSLGFGWFAIPIMAAITYAVVWELIIQNDADEMSAAESFWDSITDTVHVTFGALISASYLHGGFFPTVITFSAWLVVLVYGIARRV